MFFMKAARYIPCYQAIVGRMFTVSHPCLEREVFGMKFRNPVGLAAGLDKNAHVYNELSALGFGFIEVGTITPKGQAASVTHYRRQGYHQPYGIQ